LAQHVQYRPIGATQLVAQAIEGYRRLFRHLIVPTSLLVLPCVAGAAAIGVSVVVWLKDRGLISFPQQASNPIHVSTAGIGRLELGFAGVFLLVLVSMTLMSAVTAGVVAQGYIGVPLSWRKAMGVAFRRLGTLLLADLMIAVIYGLLTLPSLAFAFAAGPSGSTRAIDVLNVINLVTSVMELYLGVAFVILSAVIVLEAPSARVAIRRTLSLIRGRWWATLGAMVLVLVVQLLAMIVLSVVLGLVMSGVNSLVASLVALGICTLLLFPLQGITATLVYFDLRNRHGGIDVNDLAHNLRSPLPPQPVRPEAAPTVASSRDEPATHVMPSNPGPDPGAAPQGGGTSDDRPMWPAISPKPSARRPPAQPDPPSGEGGI
jgi:hypothetical protein